MRCDDYRAAFLSGEVDAQQQAHLATCPACRAEQGALEAVRLSLQDQLVWEEPSEELREYVAVAMAQHAAPPPRRTTRWWAAAAAAVVLVAAGAAWALLRPAPPDWEVVMAGTELAPEAMATVRGWNTDTGSRMVVGVTGLPSAPDGSYYELWLSGEGSHISAGSFRGSGEVSMWVGVARRDFPRLWVTLEPAGGDPAPSEQWVLDSGR